MSKPANLQTVFCCTAHSFPQSYPQSTLLTAFLAALHTIIQRTIIHSRSQTNPLFQTYPTKSPGPPTQIIELETISPSRDYTSRYFALLPNRKRGLVEMYPEESFGEVDWLVVEGLWNRGMEWVRKDEVVNERVRWKCDEHGWKYWVNLRYFEESGEDLTMKRLSTFPYQ